MSSFLPRFLQYLDDRAARTSATGDPVIIQLLRCDRAKGGGWVVATSLGDVILSVTIPSDALGYADAVWMLDALCEAIRKDSPEQLGHPGLGARPDPRFKPLTADIPTAAERTPELPGVSTAPSTQAELEEAKEPGAEAVPAPEGTDLDKALAPRPPRGKRPKAGRWSFEIVGSSPRQTIELDEKSLVMLWLPPREPADSYSAEAMLEPWAPGEMGSAFSATRWVWAATMAQTDHALWLADERYSDGLGTYCHIRALGKAGPWNSLAPSDAPPETRRERLGPPPVCEVCGAELCRDYPEGPVPRFCHPCQREGKCPSLDVAFFAVRRIDREQAPHCCVCFHALTPNLPNNPVPVKCTVCHRAGKGPMVSSALLATRVEPGGGDTVPVAPAPEKRQPIGVTESAGVADACEPEPRDTDRPPTDLNANLPEKSDPVVTAAVADELAEQVILENIPAECLTCKNGVPNADGVLVCIDPAHFPNDWKNDCREFRSRAKV